MQCPVCKTVNLTMAERQGIEIDYCPQCRGVWLDRGELDKIIERSAGNPIPTPAVAAPAYVPPVQQAPVQQASINQAPIQNTPSPLYRDDDRHYGDRDRHYEQTHHDSRYPDKDYRYGHKRKRESFLSDLFDFD
jgi:uncharacterized protein